MADTYTYIAPPFASMTGTLQRQSDEAYIPCDLGNPDYQAFLAEIAAGATAPEGWTGPQNPVPV